MRRDLRAEGLLVFTTVIWGGTFAVIKGALEDISPILLVGIRFLLAAVLAWPVLLWRRGDSADSPEVSNKPRFTRKTWLWGFLIGLGMLAGYSAQTIGLKYTSVARSGFITFSFALYVPFLQFLILKKRPGLGNVLGLLVVFWGLSFITDPGTGSLTFRDLSPLRIFRVAGYLLNGGLNRGDVFTLIGAVGYAFYVVLLDKATRVCHPGAVTVVQMLFCGVFAMVLVPFTETPFLTSSWRLAGAMFYLVVLGSVVALTLMNWFQRRLTPLRAVLIYSLEPVFAAVIGWVAFGTGMSSREIAGGLLILAGILVSDLWNYLLPRLKS
jgi:drug/metabolite transporter (DMT)-like permease